MANFKLTSGVWGFQPIDTDARHWLPLNGKLAKAGSCLAFRQELAMAKDAIKTTQGEFA